MALLNILVVPVTMPKTPPLPSLYQMRMFISFLHCLQRSCVRLQVPKEWALDPKWELEQKNKLSYDWECPSQWTPVGHIRDRFSRVHVIDSFVIPKHRSKMSNGTCEKGVASIPKGYGLDPDDPVVMAVNDLKAKVTSKDAEADVGRGSSGLRSLATPEWTSSSDVAESSYEGTFSSVVHYGKHLLKPYDTSGESDASSSSY